MEVAREYGIEPAGIVHESTPLSRIVVAYAETDLCKVKSEWYVRTHGISSWIVAEREEAVRKRVLRMYIRNELDDIYPYLPPAHREIVDEIVEEANREMRELEDTVRAIVENVREMDRREAAKTMINEKVDRAVMAAVFAVLDGKSVREAVYSHFRRKWAGSK